MNKSKNTIATVNTNAKKPSAKPSTKTETVTTETVTTVTVANNEKTNTILNIDGVKKLFVECNVLPKYTDKTHYVGCGVRSNVFSVNALKTKYNVYCDELVFNALERHKIDGCKYTENGNSNDKNRPNTIEVNTTENLKKLLQCVASNFKVYTIA